MAGLKYFEIDMPIKPITILSILFVSILLTLPQLEAEAFAKVAFVDGDPTLIRKLKKYPIKKGDIVEFKDQIITSKDEKVTLEDEKGNRIYVLSNSKLKLPNKKSKDVVLDQELGSLWFKLNPVPKDESFTVRTPTAVAGVRGTKFITIIFDDKTTDLCVCEGEVTLEVNGVKKSAKTGEGIQAGIGAEKPGSVFNNQSFIRQRRRLSRKPECMNCHSGGGGYNPSSLEGDRLILR